jgi:hypothetical protein
MTPAKPKYIYPTATGATCTTDNESNDCMVRAFANATGKSYEESHAVFAAVGRKNNKGTTTSIIPEVMKQHGFNCSILGYCNTAKFCAHYNPTARRYKTSVTVSRLLQVPKYTKGSHVFVVRGHAFCVIDGKILDQSVIKQGRRVCLIFSKD